MTTIFKEKTPFKKTYVIKNTKEDFGMDYDHNFALWSDPSQTVLYSLLDIITTTRERLDGLSEKEQEEMDRRWHRDLSEVILDCDIEGISFETPEDVQAVFNNPSINQGFLYGVIASYVNWLFSELDSLKKIITATSKTQSSGQSSEAKAEKSAKASKSE